MNIVLFIFQLDFYKGWNLEPGTNPIPYLALELLEPPILPLLKDICDKRIISMPKPLIADYVFYKIVCDDCPDYTYIGSTVNFTRRKCVHKSSCNNENNPNHNTKLYVKIREHGGWGNWTMVVVDQAKDLTLCQSRIKEEELRLKYDGNLNSQKAYTSEEERRERMALYRVENRDQLAASRKAYSENNKEKIAQREKAYKANNKDAIAAWMKEYRQQHKDAIAAQVKEYRQRPEVKAHRNQLARARRQRIKEERAGLTQTEQLSDGQ